MGLCRLICKARISLTFTHVAISTDPKQKTKKISYLIISSAGLEKNGVDSTHQSPSFTDLLVYSTFGRINGRGADSFCIFIVNEFVQHLANRETNIYA